MTTPVPTDPVGELTLYERMKTLSPDVEHLQGRRAGVVSRSIAFSIDFFCVIGGYPLIMWGFALVKAIVTFSPPSYPDPPPGLDALLYLIWIPLYFAGSWLLSGRTIGQGLMGLRVVGRTTLRFGPVRALLRFWVLFATLLIEPVWVAVSKQRLGLHDRATRTQVIYDPHPKRTVVDVALGPGAGQAGAVDTGAEPPPS